MPDVRSLLQSPAPIHFLDVAKDRAVYALQCDPQGIAVRVIRGWKCETEQGLMDEIAAALQFPDYFGENWNALHECINDLEWMPADGYLLHLCGVHRVLPDDPDGFGILLSILRDAAAAWADPALLYPGGAPATALRRPFRTLISGTEDGIARARTVLGSLA